MEGDPHRNVRLSCRRSFGSNYYQCSQSRKMSIGIAAAETIGKRAEIDQISVPQRGESSTRTNNVKKTYQTRSTKRNTYKLNEGRSSPSEMKKTSVPDLSPNAKDVHRVHATGVTKEPVRTTKEKPRDGMLSHGKRDQKNDPPNGDQTFSPMAGGTSLQINPPVIKIKENLRMKLHNIFGTKTSTEMPINKVCASEIGANVPDKPEAIFTTNKQSDVSQEVEGTSAVNSEEDLEDNQPSKLRQDSDTIESDSEDSPPHVKRKRPMAKTRPTSLKKKLSYENVDNGAFYLKEKNISAYFAATTGRRSIFKETKDDTESHMIRMTKLVPLNDRTNIPQSPVSESKKAIQVEEISLCGGMISAFKAPHQVQPNGVKCKDPYSIPEPNEKNNLGNLRSPSTPKLKRNENCTQELPPIRDNIFYDLDSPKLVMNATPLVPSPSPGDQVTEITRQSFKCMLAARKICLDDLFKFENALEKSQFICRSKNFQDRTTESRHSVACTASHPMRKRDPESEPLMSGTEHSRSTAEELSANRDTPEVMVNSPEIAHDEEQVLHERKRVCVREADEDGQSGRSLSSFLNGTRSNGPSEYDQENGLDRGIAEFGYALERVKDKLVLSTKKKCSEILTSTTEEMYSKLQSVKSQVEKDVGKLTSLSRSRKKFLETRFKEQQEQLWVIQDKFIKEISRHLEDFSNTMESFRAESSELKGVIERQQAFHQERVLQVEKTIENHLSDAQRRMAAVHEGGRLKMLQLRTAIGECFKDGVFD